MKILERGAEAIIIENKETIIKKRIRKSYRLLELDEKLRRLRTRTEAKLLKKLSSIISVPKVLEVNEDSIVLENIKGKRLSRFLEKLDHNSISKEIGKEIAKLHDLNIIHGDLTTSNMILSEKNNLVYLIDFGLGFNSARVEDKAVDLHVMHEALEAQHPTISNKTFKTIINSYKKQSKHANSVIKQLEKVESRGRYKAQY